MATEFMTVDAAAEELQMHPKTVLRFIRDGRLRASKVGRQYRILRSDLDAFAGVSDTPEAGSARTTCVVDIKDVDDLLLQRVSAILGGASKASQSPGVSTSISIAHDPALRTLKVIVIASPANVATLLNLIDACLVTPRS